MSAPSPGIYTDIPIDEYLAWEAVSAGDLLTLELSPARYLYEKTHPRERTDATDFGTVAHMLLLEPHLFHDTYGILPEGDGRTKEIKDAKAALLESGLKIVRHADYELAVHMATNAMSHPQAEWRLKDPVLKEVCLVWDQITLSGNTVRCKCRPDVMDIKSQFMIDYKTSMQAHPQRFMREVEKYGYHVSAAARMSAVENIPGLGEDAVISQYFLLAVEKTPPHEVAMYRISQKALTAGFQKFVTLLDLYCDCRDKGVWPGYPKEIVEIDLPKWAYEESDTEDLATAVIQERGE